MPVDGLEVARAIHTVRAESLHRNLAAGHVDGAADSVHLEVWPTVDEAAIDETLSEEMAAVQRMVSLGRAARSSAQCGCGSRWAPPR